MKLLRMLRHVGARQILTRASRILERQLWRLTRARAPGPFPLPSVDRPSPRSFTFLGETRIVNRWQAPDASQLWRFHLHYFDYARELSYPAFRALVISWLDAHRRLGGDAWHPYTVSLRITNWSDAAERFAAELREDPEFRELLRGSIDAHADFLANHLETDVRGNHLLENARALIRAGRIDEGKRILETELPEQILEDGGHFERSPGYHVRVLELLEDIASHAKINGIDDAIQRMRAFLAAIVPSNGRLPLLKDTTASRQPTTDNRQQPQWLAASGFAVMRDDERGDHLIADFGRVCPDYLPAHAHADMFSFELTIGGRPVIVDAGVYQYQGEWRNRFRATSAHNTVEIDGRDQSEMWGSFRVGRRARPSNVQWIDDAAFSAIGGTHDGYAPLMHTRFIVAFKDVRLWLVLDRVNGPAGHTARSHVHFDADIRIATFGGALTKTRGWISERFGEKRENDVLVLTASTPTWFGYAISADDDVEAMIESDGSVSIAMANTRVNATIDDDGRLVLRRA